MFRQSFARLYSSFGQQRKLFLLVFLWTCLCLVIFKSSLLSSTNEAAAAENHAKPVQSAQSNNKVHARAAAATPNWLLLHSSAAPLYLAPEFALPDNNNNNALYYSLSSNISSADDVVASVPVPIPAQAQIRSSSPSPSSSSPSSSSSSSSPAPAPSAPSSSDNEFLAGSQCKYNYPSLFDLQFNNIHWQKFSMKPAAATDNDIDTSSSNSSSSTTKAATYYLYNAYYDDRWRGGLPSIRILAMIDRIEPPPTNCLLWSTHLRASGSSSGSSSTPSDDPTTSSSYRATSSSSQARSKRHNNNNNNKLEHELVPLVTRASFVYAWYPKWGNYKDGLLQPWIVTCPMPRAHVGLVPDSVSLVAVPQALKVKVNLNSRARVFDEPILSSSDSSEAHGAPGKLIQWNGQLYNERTKRNSNGADVRDIAASIAMPPSFSSSSPAIIQQDQRKQIKPIDKQQEETLAAATSEEDGADDDDNERSRKVTYDCKSIEEQPITNNLPVFNQRPKVKQKFAVCVKGLDFPHEDVSVRLIEWIELLNLLGAGKIFLYNLDIHENISKVLDYYQKRGIVELSPLTLPGDQPNLPEYQHLYLKNRLTAKRQNELIPYNDCLYRNLNSYQYLALLDIDEIIMPMKANHFKWHDLMEQVEALSLAEQNYSRASYNVRNVYFFDDLGGPLGTTSSSSSSPSVQSEKQLEEKDSTNESLESGIPHYLHMMQHVYRSKNYTKPGQYVKCFHNTERVVSLHNHFPMNCFGQCTTYSIPIELAHLQHYRKDCVGPLKQSCKNEYRAFTTRDTTIWKFKQQMIRRTTRVLNHLGLLTTS